MKLGLATRAFALVLATAGLSVAPVSAYAEAASPASEGGRFVTTWDTVVDAKVDLNLYGQVDVAIDWGDGTTQSVSELRLPYRDGPISHQYVDGLATHQVEVVGTFPRLGFSKRPSGYEPTRAYVPTGLLSVEEWGPTETTNLSYAFFGAHLLQQVAEPPTGVTNMHGMFEDTYSGSPRGQGFNQPIGDWDVSSVTDMGSMFADSDFNRPIGEWDVSNVTDMSRMFGAALGYTAFDQPIGGWDVSNVTDMSEMFEYGPFNRPIGDWDVSNVTDMRQMFFDNQAFDRPLGDWDVSRVTDMSSMFAGTTSFDQPIGDWDVSNVTDMASMFSGSGFDRPLARWDVSGVTDMRTMFYLTGFNHPIGSWDVSNVTTMDQMFAYATQFDQPLGQWDVSRVTDMFYMFSNAHAFDRDLSSWCVTGIPTEPEGFDFNASSWTSPRPVWGTCPGDADTAAPSGAFDSVVATDGILRLRGTAADDRGVRSVAVAIRNLGTGKWLHRDGTWGRFQKLYTNLADAGAAATGWKIRRSLKPGTYGVTLLIADTSGNKNLKPRPWQRVKVS